MATVLAACATAGPTGGEGPPGAAVSEDAPEPLPTDPPGTTCLDWISFESPREAASAAGAVLLGTAVEQAGTVELYGVDANRWTFDVERVLERPEPLRTGAEQPPELPVSAGDRIPVVSTPETCTAGGAYPDGDPLDPATGRGAEDGTVIVILSGAWGGEGEIEEPSLITPYQGVLTPTADGALPPEWPAP
ncbi:hypothetical protein J2S48_000169 [Promicromonospora iranensis]|uniref:Uncharacterized protein n=1 Tax=Promicromonospora iranensis TaxID=1105144 RepID=A0ABU2CH42_9MICO|nr:hypothetical protein [Promicromonospora iranensis]